VFSLAFGVVTSVGCSVHDLEKPDSTSGLHYPGAIPRGATPWAYPSGDTTVGNGIFDLNTNDEEDECMVKLTILSFSARY
jgi:hypothetical protein